MAVTKEQAEREARYSERNVGWKPIDTLAPGWLVLTKIDDALEGARNIDTPMILVSRHTSFSKDVLAWVISAFTNAAGEPIRYHPTHWRPMPADWPVRREPLEAPANLTVPEPIAVFGSHDGVGLPGWEVKLCNDRTLFDTVYDMMYSGGRESHDETVRLEIEVIVDELRQNGSMDFGDGGLQMYRGVEGIVAELVGRAVAIAIDRDEHDMERCDAIKACEQFRLEYAGLVGTLRDALGDKGMEAVNAAISTPARL